MDVLRIGGETVGSELLKRMGWREGQGIGPKVRRRADLHEQEDPPHAGDGQTHLFAPENPVMISFVPKNNRRGLGFYGEERLESGHAHTETKMDKSPHRDSDKDYGLSFTATQRRKVKEKPARQSGFGVGILNDNGSDDEDPYQVGPQISYNRVIGGDKKQKRKTAVEGARSSLSASNPSLKSKFYIPRKTQTTTATSGLRRCHDGRFPLDGFVLSRELEANSILNQDRRYPLPLLPKDWKSARIQSPEPSPGAHLSTKATAKASTLDAKSRAALLGESPLPGKSVFDFLTPAARDRMVAASGKTNLPVALGETAPEGFGPTKEEKSRQLMSLIPKLDPDVARQALSRNAGGWMPYADDESKRSRYRAFLEIRAGVRDAPPQKDDGVSKDEWIAELHEFCRAAQVFRPVTGMMASRFTSSTTTPSDALGSTTQDIDSVPLLSKPASKPEDAAETAAKMGMFGPMTRSVGQFYPTRLLCKRFNVKPPANVQLDPGDARSESNARDMPSHLSGMHAGAAAAPELLPKAVINQLMLESGGGAKAFEGREGRRSAPVEGIEKVPVDPGHNEALEDERPGEAVFRAIFGDSEDEEV